MLNIISMLLLEFEIMCFGENQVLMSLNHDTYWKLWVAGIPFGGVSWFREQHFTIEQTEKFGAVLATSKPHMDSLGLLHKPEKDS